MRALDRLLSAAAPIWAGYHTHPFVRGIADGTLDREKFRYYIMQDYLYLIDYAKVFAVGIAKCETLDVMQLFAKYIEAILNGEMDIHNGYMAKLAITQRELDDMPVSLDNRSYTSYMRAVAHDGGALDTLVAILSCALSYEEIGRRIADAHPETLDHPLYGDWVRGYSGERYHRDNLRLVEMLDRLTEDLPARELDRLTDIFCTCSRYEAAFWDMAWEMRG